MSRNKNDQSTVVANHIDLDDLDKIVGGTGTNNKLTEMDALEAAVASTVKADDASRNTNITAAEHVASALHTAGSNATVNNLINQLDNSVGTDVTAAIGHQTFHTLTNTQDQQNVGLAAAFSTEAQLYASHDSNGVVAHLLQTNEQSIVAGAQLMLANGDTSNLNTLLTGALTMLHNGVQGAQQLVTDLVGQNVLPVSSLSTMATSHQAGAMDALSALAGTRADAATALGGLLSSSDSTVASSAQTALQNAVLHGTAAAAELGTLAGSGNSALVHTALTTLQNAATQGGTAAIDELGTLAGSSNSTVAQGAVSALLSVATSNSAEFGAVMADLSKAVANNNNAINAIGALAIGGNEAALNSLLAMANASGWGNSAAQTITDTLLTEVATVANTAGSVLAHQACASLVSLAETPSAVQGDAAGRLWSLATNADTTIAQAALGGLSNYTSYLLNHGGFQNNSPFTQHQFLDLIAGNSSVAQNLIALGENGDSVSMNFVVTAAAMHGNQNNLVTEILSAAASTNPSAAQIGISAALSVAGLSSDSKVQNSIYSALEAQAQSTTYGVAQQTFKTLQSVAEGSGPNAGQAIICLWDMMRNPNLGTANSSISALLTIAASGCSQAGAAQGHLLDLGLGGSPNLVNLAAEGNSMATSVLLTDVQKSTALANVLVPQLNTLSTGSDTVASANAMTMLASIATLVPAETTAVMKILMTLTQNSNSTIVCQALDALTHVVEHANTSTLRTLAMNDLLPFATNASNAIAQHAIGDLLALARVNKDADHVIESLTTSATSNTTLALNIASVAGGGDATAMSILVKVVESSPTEAAQLMSTMMTMATSGSVASATLAANAFAAIAISGSTAAATALADLTSLSSNSNAVASQAAINGLVTVMESPSSNAAAAATQLGTLLGNANHTVVQEAQNALQQAAATSPLAMAEVGTAIGTAASATAATQVLDNLLASQAPNASMVAASLVVSNMLPMSHLVGLLGTGSVGAVYAVANLANTSAVNNAVAMNVLTQVAESGNAASSDAQTALFALAKSGVHGAAAALQTINNDLQAGVNALHSAIVAGHSKLAGLSGAALTTAIDNLAASTMKGLSASQQTLVSASMAQNMAAAMLYSASNASPAVQSSLLSQFGTGLITGYQATGNFLSQDPDTQKEVLGSITSSLIQSKLGSGTGATIAIGAVNEAVEVGYAFAQAKGFTDKAKGIAEIAVDPTSVDGYKDTATALIADKVTDKVLKEAAPEVEAADLACMLIQTSAVSEACNFILGSNANHAIQASAAAFQQAIDGSSQMLSDAIASGIDTSIDLAKNSLESAQALGTAMLSGNASAVESAATTFISSTTSIVMTGVSSTLGSVSEGTDTIAADADKAKAAVNSAILGDLEDLGLPAGASGVVANIVTNYVGGLAFDEIKNGAVLAGTLANMASNDIAGVATSLTDLARGNVSGAMDAIGGCIANNVSSVMDAVTQTLVPELEKDIKLIPGGAATIAAASNLVSLAESGVSSALSAVANNAAVQDVAHALSSTFNAMGSALATGATEVLGPLAHFAAAGLVGAADVIKDAFNTPAGHAIIAAASEIIGPLVYAAKAGEAEAAHALAFLAENAVQGASEAIALISSAGSVALTDVENAAKAGLADAEAAANAINNEVNSLANAAQKAEQDVAMAAEAAANALNPSNW